MCGGGGRTAGAPKDHESGVWTMGARKVEEAKRGGVIVGVCVSVTFFPHFMVGVSRRRTAKAPSGGREAVRQGRERFLHQRESLKRRSPVIELNQGSIKLSVSDAETFVCLTAMKGLIPLYRSDCLSLPWRGLRVT